ncbi:MAG TPA: hypothetical protein EYO31_08370 [Phycisphaerales bacterium]|nr:hypothetical protein [Phycisphaerales bacterium]
MRLLRGFVRKGLLLAVVCYAFLFTATASAEYIQFTFTGEVTEIWGSTWDPWLDTQLGDPVTVQFLVDSNAEDQSQGSNIGHYSFLDLSFSIGGMSLGATDGYIEVSYDYNPNATDYFLPVFNFVDGSLGSAFVSGIDMFSSDALPMDVDWTQYASDAGGWLRPEINSDRYIRYELTHFEVVVIPAAPTLFALLLGISRRRRRL